MLSEQRRQQLDGIVQQMVTAGESDSNISFVVDDFKTKYSAENQVQQKKQPGFIQSAVQSIASPVLKTASSIAGIGTAITGGDTSKIQKEGINYGYFGNAKPIGAGFDVTKGVSANAGALKDAVGTGLEAGTTIASMGALAPGKIVVNQGLKTFAQTAGKAAVKNAAAGASFGTAKSLQNDNDWKTIAKDAFMSGLAGTAFQTGLSTVGAGVGQAARMSSEKLMNSAIRVSKKMLEQGKQPGKELLDQGFWGSLGSLKKQVDEGIETVKAKLYPKLDATPGGMSEAEVRNAAFTALKNKFGKIHKDAELNDIVNSVPLNALEEASRGGVKSVPWSVVNEVRSQLDGSINYNATTNKNLLKTAVKAMTDHMRDGVKKASGTSKEFREFENLVTANKSLRGALSTINKSFGFGLKTDIGFGIGGGLLSDGNSLQERVADGLVVAGASKALRSAPVKSGAAQVLNRSTNVASAVAGSPAGAGLRTAALNTIADATVTQPSLEEELTQVYNNLTPSEQALFANLLEKGLSQQDSQQEDPL